MEVDTNTSNEEDLECLCKLIKTVGPQLDIKSKDKMNEYFEKLAVVGADVNTPSRMRFMIRVCFKFFSPNDSFSFQELHEYRDNNWVARRKENEAKSLAAARAEVMLL